MSLSRKYDSLFAKYGDMVPVPYLRALAKGESNFNPKSDVNSTKPDSAKGLLQVIGVVRRDYNERHQTGYSANDLFDPEINVKVACDLLNRIAVGYQRNHPKTLEMDWTSKRYVQLFTFGWNAGYSEKAGVGFVVGKLEKAGFSVGDIDIDTVSGNAASFGASQYLSSKAKVRYCKQVTAWYFDEWQENIKKEHPSGIVVAGVVIGLGLLLNRLFKRQ